MLKSGKISMTVVLHRESKIVNLPLFVLCNPIPKIKTLIKKKTRHRRKAKLKHEKDTYLTTTTVKLCKN